MRLGTTPEWITFDCYGTLIDTKTGYVQFWRDMLAEKGYADKVGLQDAVQAWADHEFRLIQGPYKTMRSVLIESVLLALEQLGIPASRPDGERLAEEYGHYPPFPDVNPILTRLRSQFKLAIISNVDDDIVAHSVANMGVEFDGIFTAQQCRAYKPSPIPFQHALAGMGVTSDRVLHVAFGYKYDHTTAHELGFPTVWVNRRGHELPAGIPIGIEMPDLVGLPAYAGME